MVEERRREVREWGRPVTEVRLDIHRNPGGYIGCIPGRRAVGDQQPAHNGPRVVDGRPRGSRCPGP